MKAKTSEGEPGTVTATPESGGLGVAVTFSVIKIPLVDKRVTILKGYAAPRKLRVCEEHAINYSEVRLWWQETVKIDDPYP
jgi:hypothetical protein